jgi:predicted site-specific integrase-resolvase
MNSTKTNPRQSVLSSTPSLSTFNKAKVIAQKLGVCPRTIFRWADEGRITRHKINARVVLFDEAEVVSLVQAARV